MADQTESEPSMDEILASIRRIITDDEAPAGAAANSDAVSDTAPQSGDHAAGDTKPQTLAEPEPEMEPMSELPAAADAKSAKRDTLLSDSSRDSASSAFDKLSQAARVPPTPRPQVALTATPGVTLEDITRGLLEPLLKEWLDANLPAIVQERVEEEVARIARGR